MEQADEASVMRLFIDCEWDGWQGELISMALVPEQGACFYEVIAHEAKDPWVRNFVMPVLAKRPIGGFHKFQLALERYLADFESIELIADWPEDIAWFARCMIRDPGKRLKVPTFSARFLAIDIESDKPHNALWDARALKHAVQGLEI